MIRILHLSSEMSWRGGEQQIAYLIDELNQLQTENVVLAKKDSAFLKFAQQKNWPVFESSFNGQFDFGTARQIKKICAEKNIDLIHAHSSHSHALAVWAAVLGNKPPIVLSRRVDFPVSKNFLSQWKYNHPSIKKIICVSDCVRQILLPSIRQKEKCVVVYDGIDMNRFSNSTKKNILRHEFSIAPDEMIIANIAALAQHKDYFTWLRTVALLKGKLNAKFLIIGDGPLRNEIENEINRLQLNDIVLMTGFRNDIESVLPELDLLLFTSKEEGLGSSLLDAMLCGVPIVSTNAGGIPEIIQHEMNGLLANVGDEKQLAASVLKLTNDFELRTQLIHAGQITAKQFSKTQMAKNTLLVYHKVLDQLKLKT